MFDVAVDAMGGDHAPDVPVAAAVQVARNGRRIALVGDEPIIRSALGRIGEPPPATLSVHHAPEAIGMDEKPSRAVRKKRGASIRIAADLVSEGRAGALISAGNSGAVMAAAVLSIGRIPGVQRPAIASTWPTSRGQVVMVDLGANIDPSPVQLAQFALMGACYAQTVLRTSRPRVALLANGSEELKGNDLTRAAHEILSKSELNYAGYCEGRDVFSGQLDVVATDGFTGNVLLKTLEGFVDAVAAAATREIRSSFRASLGAMLMKRIIHGMRKKLDYEATGGAPLLGVCKRCVVAHGGSTVNALAHAIERACVEADDGLSEAIERAVRRHGELGLWPLPNEK